MCAYCEQGPRLYSSIMEEEKKKEGTEGRRGKRDKKEEKIEGRKIRRERPRERGKEIVWRNEVTCLRSHSYEGVSEEQTEMMIPQPALW